MSKCNKTEDEDEYGPNSDGPPLVDSMFVKPGAGAAGAGSGDCPPPPPPPNRNLSCSNPDLVQVYCHHTWPDFIKLALLILQLYLATHRNTNLLAKLHRKCKKFHNSIKLSYISLSNRLVSKQ